MQQYKTEQIRNIALAGHGSSGKTTLAEAMLYIAGATDRFGKISDGNTVCDFDPEEIKRKSSVSSAVAPYEWKEHKVNIIDTPGAFDFEAGVIEGIAACDSVVIELSGKSGVTVGAQRAWDIATAQKKSKIFFISKLDRESANYQKVLNELVELYGNCVCPVVIPHGKEGHIECWVDIARLKAYTYDANTGKETEVPMPQDEFFDRAYELLCEAVAESCEEYLEKYLAGEKFTQEEIIHGLRLGTCNGHVTPVLCGSALFLTAVERLLYAINDYAPSPLDNAVAATDKNGDKVEVKCVENDPTVLQVFKTVADPFVGKLSYFKVLSGKVDSDMTLVNAKTGQQEKIGKLVLIKGKKQIDVKSVGAGDIGAVAKLAATVTGDCLCAASRVVKCDELPFPHPTLMQSVVPKNKGDEGKISQSIQRLREEDPTIEFSVNPETRQQVISGLGEQHLDVVVSKLKSKFGLEVVLEKARVPYRETIRKKVKVQGKYKKQSGGHGQYGDVWVEFEPCDGDDMIFEEKVFGGAVPKNFFPAVEKGLRDSMAKGFLAGYPMVGVKATLVDGSYHPVDSSEMSFKLAANVAFKNAMVDASPVLLEPIVKLTANVPDANTGDIMGDLNKRRGRVLGMNPAGKGMSSVEAEVPMSEIGDFTTVLRSMTQGRGSFEIAFERYEQLPSMLEEKVIADNKANIEE